MSGELLKELEDDIQQEEWWTFWKAYGPLIAGTVLLTLIATAGYLWHRSSLHARYESESTRYEEALALIETKGSNDTSKKMLEELATDSSSGYGIFAQLHLFHLNAKHAPQDEEAFQEAQKWGEKLLTHAQKNRDVALEGMMVLNMASLYLNANKPLSSEISQRLAAYNVPQNPWKGLSLETHALAELQANHHKEAEHTYMEVLKSNEVSQGIQMRVGMQMIGEGFALPERSS